MTPSRRTVSGEVRGAVDDLSFGKPAFVDLDLSGVRSPRRLLGRAARLAPENVPFVAATPAWPPAEDAALERFARLLDGDFGPIPARRRPRPRAARRSTRSASSRERISAASS